MTAAPPRVLVTGATGFVGGHLVDRLVADGWRVRALVRPATDPGALASKVEVVRGDLADPDSLRRAVAGCAVVHHVAALVSSRLASGADLEAVNVRGTANLAAMAAEARVERFVHVSTCGVYGFRNDRVVDEEAPLRPDTPYRRTKARAEAEATACAERTGLPVVIARICSTLGPGGRNWVRMCRTIGRGEFRLIGDGRNRIHLGDVRDIVDGLVRCGETPGAAGRVYNLAGPAPVTMGEMAATIAAALDVVPSKRPWPAGPFRLTRLVDLALTRLLGLRLRRVHSYDLFLADRAFDITRARRELGYAPEIPVPEALRRLVAWYAAEGLLDGAARTPAAGS